MNKISGRPALERLGLDLKAARERLAQSQRQLAARTGFQQPQIARAEKGADVRLSTLIEMAPVLWRKRPKRKSCFAPIYSAWANRLQF